MVNGHKAVSHEATYSNCGKFGCTVIVSIKNKTAALPGAPNENIVQNHINIALLNVL